MSEDAERREGGPDDSPGAPDQGGEGNEGEGPAQGEQATDGSPTPDNPADEATSDDTDVAAVERGEGEDVGSPAEEVERAAEREEEAAEG